MDRGDGMQSGGMDDATGMVPADYASDAITQGQGYVADASLAGDVQLAENTMVQVAAVTGNTEQVHAPHPGEKVVIHVQTGVQYAFDFPLSQAAITLQDGDLHILLQNGGEIVLKEYAEHAAAGEIPPINFAGETIAALDVLSPEELATIQPAAGGGGPGNTGFTFDPFAPGPLPPGIGHLDALNPTSLSFGAPIPEEFVLPARLAEVAPPPPVVEECFNFGQERLDAFFAGIPTSPDITPDIIVPHDLSFFDGNVGGTQGSDLNDSLVAGDSVGKIFGLAGDDWIEGSTGSGSFLVGGEGNDTIIGGGSNDSIAGDFNGNSVFASAVAIGGEGVSSVNNFNDVIIGHGGDDAIAGDVLGTGFSDPAHLGAYGFGTGASVVAFNDTIFGEGGNDTIAGDVYQSGGGFLSADLGARASGAADTVNAFNDFIDGGAGNLDSKVPGDIIAGDVLQVATEGSARAFMTAQAEGTGNFNHSYNDTVYGGEEVASVSTEDGTLIVVRSTGFNHIGVTGTASANFNDDSLVGDVGQFVNGDSGNIFLGAGNFTGSGNVVEAFNDYLQNGQLIVGDAAQYGFGQLNADLTAPAYGFGGGDNVVFAFNDKIVAGDDSATADLQVRFFTEGFNQGLPEFPGGDTLVGDLYQVAHFAGAEGILHAGAGGEGVGNQVIAFDDSIQGGANTVDVHLSLTQNIFHLTDGEILTAVGAEGFASAMSDTIVGDVYQKADDFGRVGLYGYGFGDASVSSFNDTMSAGNDFFNINITTDKLNNSGDTLDGGNFVNADQVVNAVAPMFHDVLVGDVYQVDQSQGRIFLHARASNSESFTGGLDSIYAFNDSITGGDHVINITVTDTTDGGNFDSQDGSVGHVPGDSLVGDVLASGNDQFVQLIAGAYGNGDHVCAFNDTITGGEDTLTIHELKVLGDGATVIDNGTQTFTGFGDDVLVGDVWVNVGASDRGSEARLTATATGSNNTVEAFDDIITSQGGNDTVVGDLWYQIGWEGRGSSISLSAFASGTNLHVDAFNDQLNAGTGDNVAVGDLYVAVGSSGSLYESVSLNAIAEGRTDTVSAFNDSITAGDGNSTLVGDVLVDVGAYGRGSEIRMFAGAEGDHNIVNAFNDTLTAGNGHPDPVLVGDVYEKLGSSASVDRITMSARASSAFFSGTGNTLNAYNDQLTAGDGDSTLVGDVLYTVGSSAEGSEIYVQARVYGTGDTVAAYNDQLTAGNGNDLMVGDVAVQVGEDARAGSVSLTAAVYGSGDVLNAFNDKLTAGNGENTLVGDVLYSMASSAVGSSLDIRLHVYGSGDSINAYNDTLTAGDGLLIDPQLVGDVLFHAGSRASGELGIFPEVHVGSNYSQASNDTVSGFNDVLTAGNGNDTLIGDVWYTVDGTQNRGSDNGGDEVSVSVAVYGFGNQVDLFNDQLTGGNGFQALLVGDVAYAIGAEGFGENVKIGTTDGDNVRILGSSNVVNAFNDQLTIGNEFHATVVGDVLYSVGTSAVGSSVELGVSVSGANNTVNMFNDQMSAGDGDSTLVGDVFYAVGAEGSGSHVSLSLNIGGGEGFNTVSAFNDTLTAGNGDSTLVGDVLYRLGGTQSEFSASGSHVELDLNVAGFQNAAAAFNDQISMGDGNGLLVGDVAYLAGSSATAEGVDLIVGYGFGQTQDTVNGFNDIITAGVGEHTVVGDVLYQLSESAAGGNVNLTVNVLGSSNVVTAFNDVITVGDAPVQVETLTSIETPPVVFDNNIVGDVWYHAGFDAEAGDINVSVFASGGNNDLHVFNDTITSGNGNDLIVGDERFDHDGFGFALATLHPSIGVSGSNDTINAFNDSIGAGDGDNKVVGDLLEHLGPNVVGFSPFDAGVTVSNDGGSHNSFTAFNDTITSGSGSDTLVGDVWFQLDPGAHGGNSGINDGISLIVNAGDTLDGDNHYSLLNDSINGGDGKNLIVGDVVANVAENYHLDININGGAADNTFNMMNDTLTGGSGEDTIVGDLLLGNGGVNDPNLAFDINIVTAGTVSLGNDVINGGDGNDLLIGDFWAKSDIHDGTGGVTVGGGATLNLFGDTISGGGGNDTIWGDFLDESTGTGIGNGSVTGGLNPNSTLFDDSINGGLGNDFIAGQLGNDTLTGGGGVDTFQTDLQGTSGGNDGQDLVTDFNKGDNLKFVNVIDGAGDDFHDLLASISGVTTGANSTTISFNNGGSLTLDGVAATGGDLATQIQSLVNDATTQIQVSHGSS